MLYIRLDFIVKKIYSYCGFVKEKYRVKKKKIPGRFSQINSSFTMRLGTITARPGYHKTKFS